MRTRLIRGAPWWRRVLFLLILCHAGLAAGQPAGASYGEDRPPWLAMVARTDPADPARYVGIAADDLSKALSFFRDGLRQPASVPQILLRGDEIETEPGVIAVIRYPIGDVYIDAGTRVRIGSLDVFFGKVFARVRGLFSVENQYVVAGVEGTEFEFEVARNGSTQISVLDGIVLSSSKRLPWKPLRVTRNQAFTVTDAGMRFQVGPAPPAKLAQLRRWVRGVDDTVAVLAPREVQFQPPPQPPPQPQPQPLQPPPQPQPQPFQPPPPPLPLPPPEPPPPLPPIVVPIPVPTVQSGYCCDPGGRVYQSTLQGCRGALYESEADAYRRCAVVRIGYCCANGRVFESSAQQCRGVFSFDQGRVRASCAPPPPSGYCCADGRVTATTRNQCRGNFYVDETSARRLCVAPEQGYCCADGKVSPTTRDRCGGVFSRNQAEAQRACRPLALQPKPDAAIQKEIIKQPPSSDGPVQKKPDAALKKQIIKQPPPSDGPIVK